MNFVSSSIRAGWYANRGCRSSPRLILEIDIRQLLAGAPLPDAEIFGGEVSRVMLHELEHPCPLTIISKSGLNVCFWPIATDRILVADCRFRGITDMAGAAAGRIQTRMTQSGRSPPSVDALRKAYSPYDVACRTGIRPSIRTKNLIPEEVNYSKIAIRVTVMNKVQLLLASERREPLKPRSLYVIFFVEKDVRVKRRRTRDYHHHKKT